MKMYSRVGGTTALALWKGAQKNKRPLRWMASVLQGPTAPSVWTVIACSAQSHTLIVYGSSRIGDSASQQSWMSASTCRVTVGGPLHVTPTPFPIVHIA